MNTYPQKFSLVTGRFNALHAGHIRLFRYARSLSGYLVVAVQSDRIAAGKKILNEKLRLEGVEACTLVDSALIFDIEITTLIRALRPAWVVKGKEHERTENAESTPLKEYGGKLVFNSGDVDILTSDLIKSESVGRSTPVVQLPSDYMNRHEISRDMLGRIVDNFSGIRILTIGDLILDEYVHCEPLGMSQEDPTIVVTPKETRTFIGGAGIVAAHASGLGAKSSLVSVVGKDEQGDTCKAKLSDAFVNSHLIIDAARPTTNKRRYRCRGQTLLRVSSLNQSDISREIQGQIIKFVEKNCSDLDLIIFSDFNYGVLTNYVIDEVANFSRQHGIFLAADSQSSSQLGDISRFKGVNLITPTEREARLSLQSKDDGLIVLIERLRQSSASKQVLLKLGADGVLIHGANTSYYDWLTDRIDALNGNPVDVAGAGDSMLVATSLALVAGATIWEAALIGSIASAVQISRIGNIPLTADDLKHNL